jgi:ankyrin repeat protein
MEMVVEEGDIETLMDDSDVCEAKCKRLVALVRKTEENEVSDYMGTMLDVNTLVYDLIISDQSRCRLNFKDNSTPIPTCYVCKALDEIGTVKMADKVESERILLEAIAVSEGCFGEKHPAAFHYRVKLLLLYENWDCRRFHSPSLLLRIVFLASQVLPDAKAADLVAELQQEDLANSGQCIWLQGSSQGPFVGISARQFSALSIRDDASWDSPRNIWGIISAVVARVGRTFDESCLEFEPLFEMILKHGPSCVDGSSYFWMTIFISVINDMWGAIQNLKDLISNSTSEIFPGLTAIKSTLEELVCTKGRYELEKRPVTVGNDESCLEKGDISSLGPHQSKFDDLSKLKGPLGDITELGLVLAEISLGQLAKAEHSNVLPSFVLMESCHIHQLLCDAARLNNSTLIPKLKAQFGNLRFEGDDASFMNLLNGDGPVSDWEGDQPLNLAIHGGHYPTVEALLDAGADPDGAKSGLFPIDTAAENCNDEIVRLLIKKGARRSSSSFRVDVLRVLVESSDKIYYAEWVKNFLGDDNVFFVLFYIGVLGEWEEYEFLDVVSGRARAQLKLLKTQTPRSGEPFLRSILNQSQRNELQEFLDEEDSSGRGLELILDVLTGVHVEQQARRILRTALFGFAEEMEEILDPPEISEFPTLHTLVSRNAPNALSVFLALGPNLTAIDTKGNTALHVAASLDRVTCARQLLKFGIDIIAENKDGKTAYQIAFENGYKEIREEMTLFFKDFHIDLLLATA